MAESPTANIKITFSNNQNNDNGRVNTNQSNIDTEFSAGGSPITVGRRTGFIIDKNGEKQTTSIRVVKH